MQESVEFLLELWVIVARLRVDLLEYPHIIVSERQYLVKNDGRRYAEVHDKSGARHQLTGKTDDELQARIDAFYAEQNRGRLFKTVAEEWAEKHFQDGEIQYNTQRGYKKAHERSVEKFGEKALTEITGTDIKGWLNYLAAGMSFTKKTIACHKSMVRMVFEYAKHETEEFSGPNPADDAKMPTKCKPGQKREMPSDDDIELVQKNVYTEPYGLLHYVILYTGCRRSEALSLRYSDIDYNRKKIVIDEKGYWKNGKYIITDEMKTAAGAREVPLLDNLSKVLPIGPEDQLIFNLPGKSNLDRYLTKWRNEIGLKCTLHQLRHGFCTFLFEAGIDEKTAQYYMGHSSIEMTRDLYQHLREKRVRENDDRLNKYINGDKEKASNG